MAHSSAPADWPAAASPLVAEALQAPPRPARVLAAFPTALYLQLDRHELVLPVLAERRPDLHVVVTGRNAKDELIEAADLVTEMTMVKHPFRSGVKAQAGVEF